MTSLIIVATALVFALVASDVVLAGTKLQTGLKRIVVVWAVIYVPAALLSLQFGGVGPVTLAIFWGGSFLSWFGVRSHVESSILLKMVYLLRQKPMSEQALLSEYTASEGEGARREELVKGGLASREGERLSVTPKGRAVLGAVERLR